MTRKQFIEHQKMMAERRGGEFDRKAAEAKFSVLDKNKDGVLSGTELRALWRERQQDRKADKDADEGSDKDKD